MVIMLAFVIAAVTGVVQALILNIVLKSALSGDFKKTVGFLFLKLAVYAAVIAVIMLAFKAYIVKAALGYCLGLPGAALVFCAVGIINNKKRGDEKNENS